MAFEALVKKSSLGKIISLQGTFIALIFGGTVMISDKATRVSGSRSLQVEYQIVNVTLDRVENPVRDPSSFKGVCEPSKWSSRRINNKGDMDL